MSRRALVPILVLCVGLILTYLASYFASRYAASRYESEFAAEVEQAAASIRGRIESQIALLRGTAGLLAAGDVDDEDFHEFVRRLRIDEHYKGTLGIGYSLRVNPDALPALARRLRGDTEAFQLWPNHEREEYHTIIFLEPEHDRNQAALGYDMFTDPIRRAAMERARDTADAAASARVELVQEIDQDKQPGFLIYVPVYDAITAPTTIEGRRTRLRGFAYSPLRVRDFIEGIFSGGNQARVALAVYDTAAAPENLIYNTRDPESIAASRLARTQTIDIAGQRWVVAFAPLEGQVSTLGLETPLIIGGVLISLLMAFQVYGQVRAMDKAEQSTSALAEETRTLASILAISKDLAAELDQDKLLQKLTDQATSTVRAQFGAYFYNVVNKDGEAYMLYTLSGVPREAFEGFPMPRNTEIFGPTFSGEGVVRSDDITKDPRYGRNAPYNGMPEGHLPVKSYLAVPVVSRNGEVLGGLFFGHENRGVFTARDESIVVAIASHAAVALDNARLFEEARQELEARKKIGKEVRELNAKLEERVQRRTADLQRANAELEGFCYSVSHDMRTPLRSIVAAANMIVEDNQGKLDKETDENLRTLERSAKHMAELVDDLLGFARLGRAEMAKRPLDLSVLVDEVAEQVMGQRPATRIINEIPHGHTVEGDRQLLQMALDNLLDNAAKYKSPDRESEVVVGYDGQQGHYFVKDNGIGFDMQYLPKLFRPFERLHRNVEYPGTGIGLANVKRVIERHGGEVWAEGKLGEGATFYFRLP